MDPAENVTFTTPLSTLFPKVKSSIQLFPHQIDAVKWLVEREKGEDNGSLLADVMGLGKTRTTVSLLKANPLAKTLIVCPKSLICQWSRELINEGFRVYFINPNNAQRVLLDDDEKIFMSDKKRDHDELPESFVCLSTYGKVKPFPEPKHALETEGSIFDCANDYQPKKLRPFRTIKWDRIIVDEIHGLRNGVILNEEKSQLRKKTLRMYRMLRLSKHDDTKILGLTGTPIQNRMSDVASIYLFLGLPITARTDERKLEAINAIHMFRRNVDNLSPLSKVLISFPTEPYNEIKTIVKYETEEEKHFYMAAAGRLSEKLKEAMGKYAKMTSEDNVLTLLTLLRLLSSHPSSYVKCHNKRYKEKIPKWKGSVSKFNMIEKQLQGYSAAGESCIVFVHFYEEATQIGELDTGYECIEYINGTVAMEDRDYVCHDSKKVIDNGGCYLIIANVISCGEGLNLQHLSNVIISTPDWNPQAEEQAISRVYRIGSTRKVNVTRYYHEAIENLADIHNIDEFMKRKQKKKKELAERIIDERPNAAWSYPISIIPGHDSPCTIFPKVVEANNSKRKAITSAPMSRQERIRNARG